MIKPLPDSEISLVSNWSCPTATSPGQNVPFPLTKSTCRDPGEDCSCLTPLPFEWVSTRASNVSLCPRGLSSKHVNEYTGVGKHCTHNTKESNPVSSDSTFLRRSTFKMAVYLLVSGRSRANGNSTDPIFCYAKQTHIPNKDTAGSLHRPFPRRWRMYL